MATRGAYVAKNHAEVKHKGQKVTPCGELRLYHVIFSSVQSYRWGESDKKDWKCLFSIFKQTAPDLSFSLMPGRDSISPYLVQPREDGWRSSNLPRKMLWANTCDDSVREINGWQQRGIREKDRRRWYQWKHQAEADNELYSRVLYSNLLQVTLGCHFLKNNKAALTQREKSTNTPLPDAYVWIVTADEGSTKADPEPHLFHSMLSVLSWIFADSV